MMLCWECPPCKFLFYAILQWHFQSSNVPLNEAGKQKVAQLPVSNSQVLLLPVNCGIHIRYKIAQHQICFLTLECVLQQCVWLRICLTTSWKPLAFVAKSSSARSCSSAWGCWFSTRLSSAWSFRKHLYSQMLTFWQAGNALIRSLESLVIWMPLVGTGVLLEEMLAPCSMISELKIARLLERLKSSNE